LLWICFSCDNLLIGLETIKIPHTNDSLLPSWKKCHCCLTILRVIRIFYEPLHTLDCLHFELLINLPFTLAPLIFYNTQRLFFLFHKFINICSTQTVSLCWLAMQFFHHGKYFLLLRHSLNDFVSTNWKWKLFN